MSRSPMEERTEQCAHRYEAVARKLDAVADLLDRGWCQGSDIRPIDGRTCRCLDFAILQMTDGTGLAGAAYLFVERVVGTRHIMTWNDTPGRTQAEVVAAVRKAAERARTS